VNKYSSLRAGAAILSLLLVVAATLPASAHHAVNAQFEPDILVEMTGVLRKFELINPHSYLHMDVKNAKGEYEEWSFETGAPAALRNAGIASKDAFKLGETYKMSVHPSRDGTRTGLVVVWYLPDGRKIGFSTAKDLGLKPPAPKPPQ
jgi:hypothetical protein